MSNFQKAYTKLRDKFSVQDAAEEALRECVGDDAVIRPSPKGVKLPFTAYYLGTEVEGHSAPEAAQKLVNKLLVDHAYTEDCMRDLDREVEEARRLPEYDPYEYDDICDDDYDLEGYL